MAQEIWRQRYNFSVSDGRPETCLQISGTPRGEEGSMFNQKKKKMITALNSPKYKLSIDDMRTIAGGKKIEVVTSKEYIPVVCPDGYPSGSECFTTIAHVTIYKMRNGVMVVVGTRTEDD